MESTNTGGSFVTKINAAGTATVYSTFFGGSAGAGISSIVVDGSGNLYIGGATGGSSFPGVTGSSLQSTFGGGGSDGFVSKLNAAGSAILWSTYLGGSDSDDLAAMKIDGNGDIYVTGGTLSSSFPGVDGSSIQPSNAGNGDLYVTKMNGSGTSIIYSTFLGGPDLDAASIGALAVDSSGNAYVAGGTLSTTFAGVTGGSLQPSNGGGSDCFLTKINAAGTAFAYSTFLGGSDDEYIAGVAVDGDGNAYVTGVAESTFPVTSGAVQTTYGGGWGDAFVTKIGEP